MFKLVALTVLLAIAGTDAFWNCCANQPNAVCPRSVVSPACSGDICTVTRGEQLTANAFFTPVRAHSELRVTVTTTIAGITVTLPTDLDDACTSMFRGGVSVGCPTVPNTEHEWRIIDNISESTPALTSAVIRCE